MPGLRVATTKAEALRIERAVTQALLDYARRKGITDPIVRDLYPNTDLQGENEVGSGNIWQQTIDSAMQYNTVYSGENPNDRAFAIFKVGNKRAAPLTVAIQFYKGTGRTALKDIWQVEAAWVNEDVEAYADPEHILFYGVSEGYNIDFTAPLSGETDNVILGGKVVEPRGKTVTPRKEPW